MSQTLYEQLGKEEGITKIVDEVVDAHTKNPTISARFIPYLDEPERLAEIKKHLVYFFCAGSGGPQTYTGREMPEVHRGMNISGTEYLAVIDDIMMVLDKLKMEEGVKSNVLTILYSLKDGIIRV